MPFSEHQLLAQRGWVRSLARTLVREWDQAADLEQEAYLAALESRRDFFRSMGATATDHGVSSPYPEKLPESAAQASG